MSDLRPRELKTDCCIDMSERVTILEVNQNNVAKTLEKVVVSLEKIVLELATRKGAEKLVTGVFGAAMAFAGWAIEHFLHIVTK